jgi:transcription termination factor Rho
MNNNMPQGGQREFGGAPRGGQARGNGQQRGYGQRGGNGQQRGYGGGQQRGYGQQQRGYGQQRGYEPRGEFGQRGEGGYRSRNDEISPDEPTVDYDGVLELHPKGYGFLRDAKKSYCSQDSDPFVSSSLIEKCGLREGVRILGKVGMGARGQGPRLKAVENIDGMTVEEYANVKKFDDLTAITPNSRIKMEIGSKPVTMRVMDLLTPVGRGQRALIVAPPRTGKTMLLQEIAESVSRNHPDMHLIVLLIDERPEEVTEMRRHVRGEVVASSLDSETESHIRISQLIMERAKRLAEEGKNVFILLDSITRTARAFNKWTNTGRTATGGLDVRALDIPKKMFGSARQFEEGGSLTIVATALIDTGSRADEAIFQEFKGTGNMELVLSRDLADRRIWPAIDITKSGTRHEEKLYAPHQFESIIMLRRSLISLSPVEAMEMLTRTLDRFPTNTEFLERVKSVL